MRVEIDGIDVRIYEAALTQAINDALRKYVEDDLELTYISYMSEGTDQNFADLDRHCGDLVSKIGDIRALALEVKVKNGKALAAFKPSQHSGLVALSNAGVPVYYSYNNFSMQKGKCPASVALTDYAGCSPAALPKRSPATASHLNLKQLVDVLSTGEATFDASVYAFAVKSIASISTYEASQLSTKTLLLIYNKSLKQLMALNDQAAKNAIRILKAKAIQAKSKDSTDFLNKIKSVESEIEDLFSAELKKSQENSTLRPDVGTNGLGNGKSSTFKP